MVLVRAQQEDVTRNHVIAQGPMPWRNWAHLEHSLTNRKLWSRAAWVLRKLRGTIWERMIWAKVTESDSCCRQASWSAITTEQGP